MIYRIGAYTSWVLTDPYSRARKLVLTTTTYTSSSVQYRLAVEGLLIVIQCDPVLIPW